MVFFNNLLTNILSTIRFAQETFPTQSSVNFLDQSYSINLQQNANAAKILMTALDFRLSIVH